MKLTKRKLKVLIENILKEERASKFYVQPEEYNEYPEDLECLTEDMIEWQSLLRMLDKIDVPYNDYDSIEYPAIKIKYEDVMRVKPSGIRALFTIHRKQFPNYILVVDHTPREWPWYHGLDFNVGGKKGATNDIIVTLMPELVVKQNLGVEQTEELGWFYLDRHSMNVYPGPGC